MRGQPNGRTHLVYFAMAGLVLAFALGLYIGSGGLPANFGALPAARAESIKHVTLIIEEADIEVAPGAVWHAWTFNGTVPGPAIHLMVGDVLQVRVVNMLNLTHSFHTHLLNYNFTSDGSQANVIGGMGANAMIAPGKDYTYTLTAPVAGVFFYHCHSGDQHPITYHIHQGLYGAIMVDDPTNLPKVDHDWVIFMGERGGEIGGQNASSAPPFIMNGMGYPGGESALMNDFEMRGFNGVAAQLNKTLPAFQMKLGENARISVIDIGDQVHPFHLHGLSMVSEWYMPNRPWPANTIALVPGAGDSVIVTASVQGLWLFHCHVVYHADAGMIGVLIVTK